MRVTIYDVARTAGVGIGTVSRVINNSRSVKPDTRNKVEAAIVKLNFLPNPNARNIVLKQTGSIGVIVPFFTRPFFTEVLRGVEKATSQFGLDLILYNVETDHQRDLYFNKLPMRHKVDGFLVISLPLTEDISHNLRVLDTRVVLIDSCNSMHTSIVVDNNEGAYKAVCHLIAIGHRRIGFINGIIEGNLEFNSASERLAGVYRAFKEGNLIIEPDLMLNIPWSRQAGKEAALQLLSRKNPPTAIFAASDIQAMGVLEAAKSLNITVPGELSVVGYDGIELSELLQLTTVQQPMQYMGELGVAKLKEQINRIENAPKSPELIKLETLLIERTTTAPPE